MPRPIYPRSTPGDPFVRHGEPTHPPLPESARTARRIWSTLRILPVLTRSRFATRSVGWFLPSALTSAIGVLPKPISRRSVRSHETPEGSGGTDHADRDGSVRLEASEVRPVTTGADPVGDRLDSTEPIHDSVIPLDSASEQIKKIQERNRRRRRPFPEPPVPTFVMVGPGRYIRVEQPAPLAGATTEEADQDSMEVGILHPAENITIPAAASILEVDNAKSEFGSTRSSDLDSASDTRSEDSLVNEASCAEETEDGSEEVAQSEAELLAMVVSPSWIIAESGFCADPDGPPLPD
jgi:hypothetical protein